MVRRDILATLIAAVMAPAVTAQCASTWTTPGYPGVGGVVRAMVRWDPDGPGPLAPRFVIGGSFGLAGETLAANLVAWDPATGTWSPFGTGTNAQVSSLLVLANGELLVGGQFTSANGVACSRIARWTGSTFAPLGSGLDGTGVLTNAAALAQLPGGDIVVTGEFATAGGFAAARIARWNGSSWAPMSQLSDPGTALAVLPSGELVVGGSFQGASGNIVGYVARWNGSSWSPLGTGMDAIVTSLAVATNGDLIAGGGFSVAGGTPANRIARWNGTSWSPLGAGSANTVNSLAVLPGGDIVAANWTTGFGQPPSIDRWNGSSWSNMGLSAVALSMLPLPNGELLIGGSFQEVSGAEARNIARWNGTGWQSCNRGLIGRVHALEQLANGDLVVGGSSMRDADGVALQGLGRWNGVSWSLLASVLPTDTGSVNAMRFRSNGRLAVGGSFQSIGGQLANNLAEWDGSTWSAFGAGPPGSVSCLAELPNGELLAGGLFSMFGQLHGVLRFDGTWWLPLGQLAGMVESVVVRPNGNVIACGVFSAANGAPGNFIAEWDGTAWLPLGPGLGNPGLGMVLLPNGDLIVAGTFTSPATRVARWNGSTWSALGNGLGGSFGQHVFDIVRLPNGDLLAGGEFTSPGGGPRNLARWNGSTWSQLGTGADGTVDSLLVLPDGVAFGGTFASIDGQVTSGLARRISPCPAGTAAFGNGCAGTGGANVLTAENAPWLGATFRSRATGMPSNGLVASVLGLTASAVPLSQILPTGVAGCLLLAAPDALGLHVPTAGALPLALPVPNSASLAGQVWRQQVVAFELTPGGSIAALTSSNGLALTLGAW